MRPTFWERINKLKRIPLIYVIEHLVLIPKWHTFADYGQSLLMERVAVPFDFRSATRAAIEIDNLYWFADWHGLDSSGRDCTCSEKTHKLRTYPLIWRRLEEMEKILLEPAKANGEAK